MVLPLSSRTPHCSIARTLEVVGERWTLLVIREALRGETRFGAIRERLGVAPDVLSARLASLVEHGILERRPYREGGRTREEYVLTAAGRDLAPVLVALSQWGREHLAEADERAAVPVDATSGELVRVALLAGGDREVYPGDIAVRSPEAGTPGR